MANRRLPVDKQSIHYQFVAAYRAKEHRRRAHLRKKNLNEFKQFCRKYFAQRIEDGRKDIDDK